MKVKDIKASHPFYDPECDCEGCTAERDHFDATGRWVRDPEPEGLELDQQATLALAQISVKHAEQEYAKAEAVAATKAEAMRQAKLELLAYQQRLVAEGVAVEVAWRATEYPEV